MERAVLEREKQARLDAEAQKAELAAKLKAYEDQHQDQIRKLMELERQAKYLEEEKDEKVDTRYRYSYLLCYLKGTLSP